MKIKQYDNKCVKINLIDDTSVEGICTYDNREYNFHEYGVDEESLDILNVRFYKSDIKSIDSLENNNGIYGKFTNKYGFLEELIMTSDIDFIEQVFEDAEDEHLYRLLLYVEDNYDKVMNKKLDNLLDDLLKNSNNDRIIKKIKSIKEKGNI